MNRVLYKLVPWDEAIKNDDDSYTTVKVLNNTNQVPADRVTKVEINGIEYLIVK